jgi:hypothetical protein
MVHNSQTSLHTEPGCTAANAVQTSTLVNSTDCSFKTNSNEGCVVEDPDPNSYGAAFAAAGGGMFVTELAESGISCVVLVFTWYEITHGLDRLLLCTVPSVWFFSVRPFYDPCSPPYRLVFFIAKQCAQLVARQREQHRYFNARQTRRKLPIRSLQH